MPPRKDPKEVRKYINKYGYDYADGQEYKNNYTHMTLINKRTGKQEKITLKSFKHRVSAGTITEFTPTEEHYFALLDAPVSEIPPVHKSSFDRWLEKQDNYVKILSLDEQHQIYSDMQTYAKKIMQRKDCTIGVINNTTSFKALIEAFKVVGPRLGTLNVRLTFYSKNGQPYYRLLNHNTVNYLDSYVEPKFDIQDSSSDFVTNIGDIDKIDIEFVPRKPGKRINPGFFPYVNISDIDLSRYGIFGDSLSASINKSCLIQAMESSGLLTVDELQMLDSFIKTRTVPQAMLREIASLLNIHINCKMLYGAESPSHNNGYGPKSSHIDVNEQQKGNRSIKLVILDSHYMLNERTNVSQCYITRYCEINNDTRFKDHPRKMLLSKFDPKRYTFAKQGMKIWKLIPLMIHHKLLLPMTEKQMSQLEWSYRAQTFDSFEGISRAIKIKDKHVNPYKLANKVLQTKHFFGYEPDPNEVDYRLRELQRIVDSLPLRKHIQVSLYYKFSELMQKIMFEYGCYDNVVELCGKKAKEIRDQCVFPHPHTFNDKPLYLNKRLYYLDINGAYLAGIDGIPCGEDFREKNPKIKQLIATLYNIKEEAKKEGNAKLATTLKFMINSCWGYSIRKPKLVKHKYTSNVNNYIETFAPYVIGYNYTEQSALATMGGTSLGGYVHTVNPLVPHFTCPQFAREVLNNFNKKIEDISKIVNVYYYNIDAILIDEHDYDKLKSLGYIGDAMGQYKIEHVFTEIAI